MKKFNKEQTEKLVIIAKGLMSVITGIKELEIELGIPSLAPSELTEQDFEDPLDFAKFKEMINKVESHFQ